MGRTKLETILKTKSDNGYDRAVFCNKTKTRKTVSVHVLVATHFISNPENKPCVNHKNSIRNDNRVENLEWCTYSENSIHSVKKGRWGNKKGESNQNSKYKERDIKIIRKLHKDGFYSQQEIAEMFEDGQSNISRIILRQRWSHI